MESVGFIAPESRSAARAAHERCGPVAREIVREVAIAMGMDDGEFADRVTDPVIETAQDAVFGSRLRVHVGTVSSFDAWLAEPPFDAFAVQLEGSEHVDGRAWHAAPAAEQIAAVSFDTQEEAAVSTVRRQAYGRIYEDLLYDEAR